MQSGSWSGTNPIVLTYQWRRCNSAGAACSDIAGATGQTYTLTAADVDATIRISVTGTNSAGAGKALSDPTAAVSALAAPLNTALPSVSGSARQGATLTAGNGSWSGSGPIGYAYQWQRCDSHGAGCSAISGATAASYTATSADVGHTLRVAVTAKNAGGSTTALSGYSAGVAAPGAAPANTNVPTLSGSASEGSAVTVGQGGWNGSGPISFSYSWQRCDASGNTCSAITGATDPKYTLARADVGNRVRGAVTASNSEGATTAYSELSTIVGSTREPVNTQLPTITGTVALGRRLTAAPGAWSGAAPFQFYYQWARSNGKGGFDPIAEATEQSYTLTTTDLGHQLFVQIKAQNAFGPAWANSKPTATVASTAAAKNVVSITTVSLPDRLNVARVAFTPSTLRTRDAFQLRVSVTNSSGNPVQGALVYALGLPYGWVAKAGEQQTGSDGSVTLTLVPTAKLPIGHRNALVVFVRARKPGGSVLTGVSTRRLVQVRIR
jgi:hypothetical protein